MSLILLSRFERAKKIFANPSTVDQASSKQQETVTEPLCKEIVKEVPVPSRLTFAHDPHLYAARFYLVPWNNKMFGELKTNSIFTIGSVIIEVLNVYEPDEGENEHQSVYPIFKKMPSMLPFKLFPYHNIICIGGIRVQTNNNRILGFTKRLNGKSLHQIINEYHLDGLIDTSPIQVMNHNEVIRTEEIEGDISYEDYRIFHAIDSTLDIVLNDGWY